MEICCEDSRSSDEEKFIDLLESLKKYEVINDFVCIADIEMPPKDRLELTLRRRNSNSRNTGYKWNMTLQQWKIPSLGRLPTYFCRFYTFYQKIFCLFFVFFLYLSTF